MEADEGNGGWRDYGYCPQHPCLRVERFVGSRVLPISVCILI